MKTAEERRAQRIATCRHFTGIQNPACKEAIAYSMVRELTGKGPAKFACLGDLPGKCPKYQPHTAEEIDAQAAERDRRFSFFGPARKAILATKLPRGRVDCPMCKGKETLAFNVARSNGHVHAMCSTKGCLSWME